MAGAAPRARLRAARAEPARRARARPARSPASTRSATWPGGPGVRRRLARRLRGRERAHHRGRARRRRGAGVRRVLLASSSSVYGRGGRPGGARTRRCGRSPHYGRSKRRGRAGGARAWRGAIGIELVVLRYFTVYGPRQRPDMAFARFVSAALERRARCRCWATAGRCATSPTWATPPRPRRSPLERGATAAYTTWPAARPATLAHAFELLGEHARPRARRSSASPRTGATRAAPAPTSTRARAELGWEPRTALARRPRRSRRARRGGRGALAASRSARRARRSARGGRACRASREYGSR